MTLRNCLMFASLIVCAIFMHRADAQCEYGVWQLADRVGLSMIGAGSNIDHIVDSINEMASKVNVVAEDTSEIDVQLSILDATLYEIKEDFHSIFEKLEDGIEMFPIPINSAPYTISTSGTYIVNAPLTDTITIDVDNVVLDLNGYSIVGTAGVPSVGIQINTEHRDIVIKNGFIDGAGSAGIFVDGACWQECANILLEQLMVTNCATGIDLAYCNNCHIVGCMFSGNSNGLSLVHANNNVIDACVSQANTHAAYSLIDSSYNNFRGCIASGTSGSDGVYGFYSFGGIANAFDACDVTATQTLSTDSSAQATGIYMEADFGSSVTKSFVANSLGYTSAKAYGIHALGDILLDQKTIVSDEGQALTVDWSACGEFLAMGGILNLAPDPSGVIFVYGFDQGQLTLFDTVLTGREVSAIAWSPSTNYLAVVGYDKVGLNDVGFIKIYDASMPSPGGIIEVASVTTGSRVNDVAWSPDGKHLAVAAVTSGVPAGLFEVYEFIPSSMLSFVDSYTNDVAMKSVAWSSDGVHIATGGFAGVIPFFTGKLRLYTFDGSSVAFVEHIDLNENIVAVDWSGVFLAAASRSSSNGFLSIFQLKSGNLFLQATGQVQDEVSDVSWSPYGMYVATSGSGTSTVARVYQFAQNGVHLLLNYALSDDGGESVSWRNQGAFLAVGYQGEFQFAATAVIDVVLQATMSQNLCHGVSAGPTAVGLAGNTLSAGNYSPNAIWNNRAYDNGANFGANIENVAAVAYLPGTFDNISL